MKYFLDTEFVEGTQAKTFLGFKIGETKPTIDLISIGIVAEDGREYYAISKDFNLKEAWNRYQQGNQYRNGEWIKEYWLRENVLYPIFVELFKKENQYTWDSDYGNIGNFMHHMERSGKAFDIFERLITRYGKTNKEIAIEIQKFVCDLEGKKAGYIPDPKKITNDYFLPRSAFYIKVEFYADYCSYDWVVFCWLFGKMIDLPKGFPMYCNDIQQLLKQKADSLIGKDLIKFNINLDEQEAVKCENFTSYLQAIKKHPDYPKQEASKKHHALEDARYDRDLYNFLNSL